MVHETAAPTSTLNQNFWMKISSLDYVLNYTFCEYCECSSSLLNSYQAVPSAALSIWTQDLYRHCVIFVLDAFQKCIFLSIMMSLISGSMGSRIIGWRTLACTYRAAGHTWPCRRLRGAVAKELAIVHREALIMKDMLSSLKAIV